MILLGYRIDLGGNFAHASLADWDKDWCVLALSNLLHKDLVDSLVHLLLNAIWFSELVKNLSRNLLRALPNFAWIKVCCELKNLSTGISFSIFLIMMVLPFGDILSTFLVIDLNVSV